MNSFKKTASGIIPNRALDIECFAILMDRLKTFAHHAVRRDHISGLISTPLILSEVVVAL